LLPEANDDTRAKLKATYVELELFLNEEEYAAVRNFEDATHMDRSAIEKADSAALRAMTEMIKEAPQAQAEAIQERITERMVARTQEVEEIGAE